MARTDLTINSLGDKFVDYREQIWGDSFNWAWTRGTNEVKFLVIHHSVTAHEATPDEIALIHKNKGWGGVGYHFIITKDGKVWYVGDVSTARANVADMNEKVIGICMVGDFTKYLPSDEQIISAHKLCQWFLDQPQWPNLNDWKEDVVGHKDLGATQCPGTSWDKSQDGDMWWRIKTGTTYSGGGEPNGTSCEDQLSDCKTSLKSTTEALAGKTIEVDDFRKRLEDQERDNRDLTNQVLEAREKRDTAIREKNEMAKEVEKATQEIAELNKGIEVLEASETALKQALKDAQAGNLDQFSGLDLILKGFAKLLTKKVV